MAHPLEVQRRLGDYLGTRIERLAVLASGWETTVFEFALGAASAASEVPAKRPLVLRFYLGSRADEKGPREYKVLQCLAAVGYPAPRPYLFEPAREPLGAPFLIMERSEGGPLLQLKSFPQALKTFSLAFFAFVRAHAALHRLDPDLIGLGPSRALHAEGTDEAAPLLERVLDTVARRVEDGPLPGLEPMLQWARERAVRIAPPARESILHLDYHPQNAVVRGVRVTGIVDWVNTDLGDRHLDAATTSAIMASSAMERPCWMRRNAAGNSLRKLFTSLYVALHHAIAPLDFERLRYYQAVAALQRLSMLGMMRARGAEAVGFRPEAVGEVTPAVLALLSRYAARKSGVPLRLGPQPTSPA